ncbi:hypothetical protein ACS0TY_024054 [Phlomoides rotata]
MAKRLKVMYGKPPPVVENQEHDGANYKSGYEHDLGSARKLLFEQLDVVPGLSIKDKLKASVLIGGKVEYLEIWSTLPDEARVIYVNDVLGLEDND